MNNANQIIMNQTTANNEGDTSIVLLTGAVTVLSLIAIYHHIKVFSFWSSRGIKGPRPWPFLGTNIYYLFENKPHLDEEWRQKYGHTYGLYDGYYPALRTSDNQLIKHVWIKNFSSFTDRDTKFIYGDNLSQWLFWSRGDNWRTKRTLVNPMFTSVRMKSMFSTMSDCMDRFKREIDSRLNNNNTNNVFSKDDLMSLALDVIALSFFSIKLDTYRDKTSDFFKRAFAFANFDVPHFILWTLTPSPICKYFKIDLSTYSKYEYFEKLGQATIDNRRQNNNNENIKKNDFIQQLLEAKVADNYENVYSKEDDIEAIYNDKIGHEELERLQEINTKKVAFRKFSDSDIRSQMTFFFLAGFETTSTSLSFCFYELAHQQAAQEEVYCELMGIASGTPGQVKNEQQAQTTMDYSNLSSFVKLDSFVAEALRLYSPVTEHIRVVTAKEGVMLPTDPPVWLPQNCPIGNPVFVTQRDSDYWEEPLKFDMTRFYPENRNKIATCSYGPFGLGPRNCAGMRFALMTLKLCLAQVLLKYKVMPGPKTRQYPPKFNKHAFFLQLANTDFELVPR